MQVDGNSTVGEKVVKGSWKVVDCLAQWWRPNFESFMVSRLTLLCLD